MFGQVVRYCLFVSLFVGMNGCDDSNFVKLNPNVVWISANPAKSQYDVGDRVSLSYQVFDANEQVIKGIPATWQVPKSDDARDLGNQVFEFLQPGSFTWTVTLDPPYLLQGSLTLKAGPRPATVSIVPDPRQDYYLVGDTIKLTERVQSADGQEIKGVSCQWQVPAGAGVRDEGFGRYTFLAEGSFAWSVRLDAPYDLSANITLTADGKGPDLILETPERGDSIIKNGQSNEISVTGRVRDDISGLGSVSIRSNANAVAATPIEPEADGAFSLVIPAVAGMNSIEVEAQDKVGHKTRQIRSVVYAAEFSALPQEDPVSGEVPPWPSVVDALLANISDKALDRGRLVDVPPYDPCSFDSQDTYRCSELRDFASLLELALNGIDFPALAPKPSFNFPLVDQQLLSFDLQGFATVSARMVGNFVLDFNFQKIDVGLGKVDQMQSVDGGIETQLSFKSYDDSTGTTRPGLNAQLGMTGTLTTQVILDLATTDPDQQQLLCLASLLICNPDPPYDCLFDYLASCNTEAVSPIAQVVSTVSAPLLGGLAVPQIQGDVTLDVALQQQQKIPGISLRQLKITLGTGTLDLSALQNLDFNLGTANFAGYILELGTYQLPVEFISQIVDQVLEPLVNVVAPFFQDWLGQLFSCADASNPLCVVGPVMEDFFRRFTVEQDFAVANPFDSSREPLGTLHLQSQYTDLSFAAVLGGQLTLDGSVKSKAGSKSATHRDDDLLGLARLRGCLAPYAGFEGYNQESQPMQFVSSLDFVNQILFALWWADGLELELTEKDVVVPAELEVSKMSLKLQSWLPPMIDGCATSSDRLGAAWGDVRFELRLERQGRVYASFGFASAVAQGVLSGAGNPARSLMTLQTPYDFFTYELSDCTVDGQPAHAADQVWVGELVGGQLLPQVLERVINSAFSDLEQFVPQADLGNFPGVPANSALVPGNYKVHSDGNYLIRNASF